MNTKQYFFLIISLTMLSCTDANISSSESENQNTASIEDKATIILPKLDPNKFTFSAKMYQLNPDKIRTMKQMLQTISVLKDLDTLITQEQLDNHLVQLRGSDLSGENKSKLESAAVNLQSRLSNVQDRYLERVQERTSKIIDGMDKSKKTNEMNLTLIGPYKELIADAEAEYLVHNNHYDSMMADLNKIAEKVYTKAESSIDDKYKGALKDYGVDRIKSSLMRGKIHKQGSRDYEIYVKRYKDVDPKTKFIYGSFEVTESGTNNLVHVRPFDSKILKESGYGAVGTKEREFVLQAFYDALPYAQELGFEGEAYKNLKAAEKVYDQKSLEIRKKIGYPIIKNQFGKTTPGNKFIHTIENSITRHPKFIAKQTRKLETMFDGDFRRDFLYRTARSERQALRDMANEVIKVYEDNYIAKVDFIEVTSGDEILLDEGTVGLILVGQLGKLNPFSGQITNDAVSQSLFLSDMEIDENASFKLGYGGLISLKKQSILETFDLRYTPNEL